MSIVPITGEHSSPFDQIKHVRPDGSEWWSARELMPLMGYSKWEHFSVPLRRAITSASNQRMNAALNFPRSRKVSGERGPASEDFQLTRFAAYLVAMNGDPNKREVAAAQAYFAVKTREAEVTPTRELSGEELMAKAILYADERMKALTAQVEQRDVRLALAEPKASAWDLWLSSNPAYSVDRVAKALVASGAKTGRNRLLVHMGTPTQDGGLGWIFRDKRGQWTPYQAQVETGRLVVKLGTYEDAHTGEIHGTSTVRITAKGAAKLATLMDLLPETVMNHLTEENTDAAA